MIKKVLSITASTLIVAGAATPALASGDDVFSRLMIRGAGHYSEPSNERAVYATKGINAAANAQGENYFVEPGGDWDYTLGLEYMLPGSNTSSLLLDYDHYSTADSKSISGTVDNNNGNIVDILNTGGAAGSNIVGNGSLSLKDRTFRLGARRVLPFGDNFDVQLGAYAEHSKVERHQTVSYTGIPAGRTATVNDEASGWGPSFDLVGRWYPVGRHSCFSVLAGAEFAALWADSSHSERIVDQTGTLAAAAAGIANDNNRADLNTITTRLGASVALAYSRPINDSFKLGLRAGARWINYHNAFKGVSDATAGRTDYGRMGPFIELRIGGVDSTV